MFICRVMIALACAAVVNGACTNEYLKNMSQCAQDMGHGGFSPEPISTSFIKEIEKVCEADSVVMKGIDCMVKAVDKCADNPEVGKMTKFVNIHGIKGTLKEICDNRAVIEKHVDCIAQQAPKTTSECIDPLTKDQESMTKDGGSPSDDEICGVFSRAEECFIDMYDQCSSEVKEIFKKALDHEMPVHCGCSVTHVSLFLLTLLPFVSRYFQ